MLPPLRLVTYRPAFDEELWHNDPLLPIVATRNLWLPGLLPDGSEAPVAPVPVQPPRRRAPTPALLRVTLPSIPLPLPQRRLPMFAPRVETETADAILASDHSSAYMHWKSGQRVLGRVLGRASASSNTALLPERLFFNHLCVPTVVGSTEVPAFTGATSVAMDGSVYFLGGLVEREENEAHQVVVCLDYNPTTGDVTPLGLLPPHIPRDYLADPRIVANNAVFRQRVALGKFSSPLLELPPLVFAMAAPLDSRRFLYFGGMSVTLHFANHGSLVEYRVVAENTSHAWVYDTLCDRVSACSITTSKGACPGRIASTATSILLNPVLQSNDLRFDGSMAASPGSPQPACPSVAAAPPRDHQAVYVFGGFHMTNGNVVPTDAFTRIDVPTHAPETLHEHHIFGMGNVPSPRGHASQVLVHDGMFNHRVCPRGEAHPTDLRHKVLVVAGGADSSSILDDIHMFRFDTHTWEKFNLALPVLDAQGEATGSYTSAEWAVAGAGLHQVGRKLCPTGGVWRDHADATSAAHDVLAVANVLTRASYMSGRFTQSLMIFRIPLIDLPLQTVRFPFCTWDHDFGYKPENALLFRSLLGHTSVWCSGRLVSTGGSLLIPEQGPVAESLKNRHVLLGCISELWFPSEG